MAFFTRSDNSFKLVITIFILCLHCENLLTSAAASSAGFVQTRGTRFILNGSPFLFNGFNSYWMMRVATQPSQRYKVSNVYREAKAAGLTVCRTWAFNDGGDQALQMSPGVYDERVFQVLAERMEPFDDGYEIVLSQDPSTARVIAQQSSQMASIFLRNKSPYLLI